MASEKYRGKPHGEATLDDRGRITIPSEVRRHLPESDKVVVVYDDDGARIEPAETAE